MTADHTADRATVSIRFSAAEIAARVDVMAAELAAKLPADTLVVSVLKGSFVFAADLIRALSRAGANWSMDFITLSSYGTGTKSSGNVQIVRDIVDDVRDRDVLLVDDIFDTGVTLSQVVERLRDFKPKSVRSAVLLRKNGRQEVDYVPDFIAFEIPDEFVVGYGLDYEDMYRNLPYLAALEADDLAKHPPTSKASTASQLI